MRAAAFPLLLLLPGPAWASGFSLDSELLVPSFSGGELPGLDGALTGDRWAGRGGLIYQYQLAPVALYDNGSPVGEPVTARATVFAGGSLDLSSWLTVHAALPVADQIGDPDTGLEADGFGLGDARVGARALLPGARRLHLGVSADLYLPTGTKNAWLGEVSPRARLALVSRSDLGPAALLLDAAVLARPTVDTGLDLAVGPELQLDAALRMSRGRLAFWGGGQSRAAVGASTLAGRASVEAMVGGQLWFLDRLRLDVAAGTGLTQGYGADQVRALAGLTWGRRVEPAHPTPRTLLDPLADADEISDERPATPAPEPEAPPPAPEPAWEDGELARVRVETSQIEIRDPIQFEFGTDRVLPSSLPTLVAVAALLDAHPEIESVVIEGHASEEGSFAYNYDLAYRRAGAIFRELVLAGVHPYRLSTRSMGEVVPLSAAEDETSLAANRRVEFHINRQRSALDLEPPPSPTVRQPWDGAPLASGPAAEVQP